MLPKCAKAYSSSCSQTIYQSISSHFVELYSWSVRCSRKSQKSKKTLF